MNERLESPGSFAWRLKQRQLREERLARERAAAAVQAPATASVREDSAAESQKDGATSA